MLQKIRNQLPKLFRKADKEKFSSQCDFDLANTFILLLSQKMQKLAVSKRNKDQEMHAYFFKNSRRSQQSIGDEDHVTGGQYFQKGQLSQRASRYSLPSFPNSVNYSWLFDSQEDDKLNCFERAKIRDQCRQLTLDQSILAYEIFLKRSEKITEPRDLPRILDEILTVLLCRKPVRKNCMEVFKQRMEAVPYLPSGDSEESFSSRKLTAEVRPRRKFRPREPTQFHYMRKYSQTNCGDNNLKTGSKDKNQDQDASCVSKSETMSAVDKIRVVYVKSQKERPRHLMSEGDVGNISIKSSIKDFNTEISLKDRPRKVHRCKYKSRGPPLDEFSINHLKIRSNLSPSSDDGFKV